LRKEEAKASIFVCWNLLHDVVIGILSISTLSPCEYKDTVCEYVLYTVCGGRKGLLGCVGDHILKDLYNGTRIRVYKIACPPQEIALALGGLSNYLWTGAALYAPYVARDIMILMQENPFQGPLKGVGPENRDFFGPWNGRQEKRQGAIFYIYRHLLFCFIIHVCNYLQGLWTTEVAFIYFILKEHLNKSLYSRIGNFIWCLTHNPTPNISNFLCFYLSRYVDECPVQWQFSARSSHGKRCRPGTDFLQPCVSLTLLPCGLGKCSSIEIVYKKYI
jgi:hypothetical protein